MKDNGPLLPLAEVVLYTSGVGYFRRVGPVEGDAQVELRFKTEDEAINALADGNSPPSKIPRMPRRMISWTTVMTSAWGM